jgi:hypothetical protein
MSPKQQSRGARLVDEIRREMDDQNLEPTAAEAEMLRVAENLANRLQKLEDILDAEGPLWTSPNGTVKGHPAAIEHRQLAISLSRVLSTIAVAESTGGARKDKTKQRAANRRWNLEAGRG